MVNKSLKSMITTCRFEYGFQCISYRQHLCFVEKKLLKVGNIPYIPYPKYVKKL